MKKVNRLILLNQMAGPLFRELAEGLSFEYKKNSILYTGHPDTIKYFKDNPLDKLELKEAPKYNTGSTFSRIFSWLKYTFKSTKYILFAKKNDAIIFVSNPPILGIWIYLLSFLNKVPYLVLVYDIHPNVLIEHKRLNKNGFIAKMWIFANKLVYRRAENVVTIGNEMASVLKEQMPSSSNKLDVVYPWSDVNKIKPIDRNNNPFAKTFNIKNEFIVLYSGNMGASHDIESILIAAKYLQDVSDIKFIFIGEGERKKDIFEFIKKNMLSNINVYPFQPEENFPYTLGLANISIVSLDVGMEKLMIPSKSFAYLSAGSPILAIGNNNSSLSEILNYSKCGILIPPRKPMILKQAIYDLYSDKNLLYTLSKNARKLAIERFSKEKGINKFKEILKKTHLLQ